MQTGLTGANTNITAITNSPVTFQSNVTILGNLVLAGNTTIVAANTVSFGDSLLSLASNSTSDILDIGLYGHYSGGGFSNNHTGVFRSVASQDWMFFATYAFNEPTSTIDISNSTFSLANVRVRTANASLNVTAANAILGTSVFSGAVELRANDYATYLMAKGGIDAANTTNANQTTGLNGANTNITNLQTGLAGANTTIATKANDVGAANQLLYRNSSNVLTGSSGLTYDGVSIRVNGNLESTFQSGLEGGEIFLNRPASGTSLAAGVTIDVYENRIRFFENGGTLRGAYIDLTATSASVGSNLLSSAGGTTLPAGSIIMFGANTAPSGWLVCDGTAVSRTTYSGLYSAISTNFGVGDNSTTFNLPDFRGRSPYGVDASQSLTIGANSAGKINTSFQNSTGTGTTGTGTTGTSTTAITATTSNTSTTVASSTGTGTTGTSTTGTGTTGTSSTAITATTSNTSTTVASSTSTGTTAGGTGIIPALTYSTGTGTTGGSTTGTGTTGTGTTGSGGLDVHSLTTVAYQQPVLVKDQATNALVRAIADHAAHTHSIPGLSVPGLSVPGLSVPALSIPAMNVTVPGLSIPALTIPSLTVNGHTHNVPALTIPGLSIPALTVPGLSIPALTIPSLTVNGHTHNVPALTIPGLSIPGLSVPALTVTHPGEVVQFIIKT